MKTFRTYELAVQFYRSIKNLHLPAHLKSQLLRAASSVALNLAEGRGKFTRPDQRRFQQIAFGSVRECQAIFDLIDDDYLAQAELLDHLAASLFKLLRTGH
ncbi:MAG: four helix bundle protein [Oligoflexales bacterium]